MERPLDNDTRLALLEQQMRLHTEDCLLDRAANDAWRERFKIEVESKIGEVKTDMKTHVAGLTSKLDTFDAKLWGIVVLVGVGVAAELMKAFLT